MEEKRRILIVDDDEDILQLLQYNLEKEGYEVMILARSEKALSVAKTFSPDLIILDIMMPNQNGIELCRKLRDKNRFKNIYIFFLTARSESYYRHAVFHTGGDDYIEKIIGLKALTKKIDAVLRKNYVIRKSITEFKTGNLYINRESSSVKRNGLDILLTKPEFELLFFMAQNPMVEISMDNLVQSIWGSEIYLTENSVEIYVQSIRRKLGADIIKQHGDQYRFIA
jgi:two-component system, OmpR family, alkaline phosphatase synthesis response regulator PhoP